MSTRNFLEEFKFQLFSGTMTNRLVIVNVLVFIFIVLLEAIFRLLKMDEAIIENFCSLIFTLDYLSQKKALAKCQLESIFH